MKPKETYCKKANCEYYPEVEKLLKLQAKEILERMKIFVNLSIPNQRIIFNRICNEYGFEHIIKKQKTNLNEVKE